MHVGKTKYLQCDPGLTAKASLLISSACWFRMRPLSLSVVNLGPSAALPRIELERIDPIPYLVYLNMSPKIFPLISKISSLVHSVNSRSVLVDVLQRTADYISSSSQMLQLQLLHLTKR